MTPPPPVNCGRCAHLWSRAQPGFGICACRARQDQTGRIRPQVALDATCEFASLSAKLDPDFLPRLRAARSPFAPPVLPAPPPPLPRQHELF